MTDEYFLKKDDAGKLRWDLLDLNNIEAIAAVLTYGVVKYSPDSWQTVPDAERRYWAAMMRHLKDHQAGDVNNPESGLPHLHHAFCNLYFLVWLQKNNTVKKNEQCA